jgi:DNA-binding transcriptional MocR family regulator
MLIPLKLVRDQQLQQQIFDQLRDLIVSNRLRPGSRMPSSRMMAEQFSISRTTVLLTYERLVAEGYVETRPAAGTFVARAPAHAASLALSQAHPPVDPQPRSGTDAAGSPMHHAGDRAGVPEAEGRVGVPVGVPDPSLFPAQRWRSLMRSSLDQMGMQAASEHPAGHPGLRDALASWLSTSRGLAVSPEQVMLLKGRQQALHVAAHLAPHPCEGRWAMTRSTGRPGADPSVRAPRASPRAERLPGGHLPGGHLNGCPVASHAGMMESDHASITARDHTGITARDHTGIAGSDHLGVAWNDQARIIVEDPCDPAAAAGLAGEGGALVRVPVDADGLCTDHLPAGDAALIHVTPEHQRPLGVVMSRARRIALLEWAARAGALVLEEDIDGELRYGTMGIPSLMSLDRSERVILLGGFSVSLGPWLDVSYMVLPRWLVPFALATRRMIDDSRSHLEQMALAGFLGGGGYARHLHRLSKVYASRRDALLAALRRHLGGTVRVWGQHAGLHLAWFPPPEIGSARSVATLARRHGLNATALRDDAILLGFGMPDEHHIEPAVRLLAEALTGGRDAGPSAADIPGRSHATR